jgi:hypothetical protein
MAPKEMPQHQITNAEYNAIFDGIRSKLAGYVNNDWSFENVHAAFQNNPKPYIGTHLHDEGHELVAQLLSQKMKPVLDRVLERRATKNYQTPKASAD